MNEVEVLNEINKIKRKKAVELDELLVKVKIKLLKKNRVGGLVKLLSRIMNRNKVSGVWRIYINISL